MSCEFSQVQDEPQLFDLGNPSTVALLESLYEFKLSYGSLHKYISAVLCAAGVLANLVHICVLTRPHMRRSAVHTALTCIAIADVGTMTSYLIYIVRFEFMADTRGYPLEWAEFLRVHAVLSIALHAISIYLVVFMAFIRFLALDIGQSRWMRPKLACIICALVAALILVICIPTYLAHEIYQRGGSGDGGGSKLQPTSLPPTAAVVEVELPLAPPPAGSPNILATATQPPATPQQQLRSGSDRPLYSVGFSTPFVADGCRLLKLNLWLTGVLLKAAPCALLLCFTVALLRRMRANERKRHALFSKIGNSSEPSTPNVSTTNRGSASASCPRSPYPTQRRPGSRYQQQQFAAAERATFVLLLMLLVFLLTELPQGLFAVLNALYTYQFHAYVYMSIADVLDLLSLINCYVAFTVYMITSSNYRETLISMVSQIFLCCFPSRSGSSRSRHGKPSSVSLRFSGAGGISRAGGGSRYSSTAAARSQKRSTRRGLNDGCDGGGGGLMGWGVGEREGKIEYATIVESRGVEERVNGCGAPAAYIVGRGIRLAGGNAVLIADERRSSHC